MNASTKHFRVHAPHAHDTQTKLSVSINSALALNQIGNLDIPFNFPKLLIFSKVYSRYWLIIFVNSIAVTCSCKLISISLQVILSVNTINTRQNQIKVGNPRQLTAGKSYIAGHQRKLGQIENIWRRKCYLRNSK